MFKIGDYVRVERVSKQDELHSRFVGEIGVFQGYDEEGYGHAQVRFKDWSLYLVDKEAISLHKGATIKSIMYAYCLENEEELIGVLEKFFEERLANKEQGNGE